MQAPVNSQLRPYFETLQLQPHASAGDVKRSARRLLLLHHPDLNPHDRGKCEEKTKSITEAYRRILDALGTADPVTQSVSKAPDADAAPRHDDFLVFELSGRLMAFPAGAARRILRVRDVRVDNVGMVTEAFPYMAGAFYHGRQVAMLWNLYLQLGLKETPLGSDLLRRQIIVVEHDDSTVGFLVDAVRGVMSLDRQTASLPGDDGPARAFLAGFAASEDGPVGLLDLNKILYTL